LVAAQNQCVIDFLLRALHAMREPPDYVLRVARENLINMIEPSAGFGAVVWNEWRRAV
jgi:hypothetical protein